MRSVSSWGRLEKKYDLKLYKEAVQLFAKALPEYREVRTFKIDLINFLRQQIANEADSVYAELVDSYKEKEIDRFEILAERFLGMIDSENELLAQDPFLG